MTAVSQGRINNQDTEMREVDPNTDSNTMVSMGTTPKKNQKQVLKQKLELLSAADISAEVPID